MPVVLFTCAGQRVDIVEAFGRAGATTVAADLNELAPALYAADVRASVPPVDDSALRGRADRPRRRARRRADRPARRPRPPRSRRQSRRARRARAAGRARDDRALRGQVPREPLLRVERNRKPAHLASGRASRRASISRPREGAARLRLSAYLPSGGSRGARLLPSPDDGGVDDPAGLHRRGVLDRCLLGSRRALPRRRPADDDRVEGRRVDQGDDDQGRRT